MGIGVFVEAVCPSCHCCASCAVSGFDLCRVMWKVSLEDVEEMRLWSRWGCDKLEVVPVDLLVVWDRYLVADCWTECRRGGTIVAEMSSRTVWHVHSLMS